MLRYQAPAILWAIAIYVSSSIPADKLPDFGKMNLDKVIHFFVYFLLAATTHRAARHQSLFPAIGRHHLIFPVVMTLLYGLSDEFHQAFVPNRNSSLFDLLADVLGGCLYVGVYWVISRRTSAGSVP